MKQIQRVLVVGAGAMGSQIGEVCALGGLDVTLHDLDESQLLAAGAMIRTHMESNVDKGRLTSGERDAAFGRLWFTTDLKDAARAADFVIEAVVEKLDIKQALFAELDQLCPEHTILTSNSSSFVPSSMALATARPGRFCGMHFFNPALVMRCVEVVRGLETSEETIAATVALAVRLGKEPVVLEKEIDGFVANRILNAIRDEGAFLMENGYASIEAIDTVCRGALGHPMGPFELQDLTGLDIGYLVRKGRYAESGNEKDKPPRSLTARVAAGHLGRKTGEGWYRYDEDGNRLDAMSWSCD